MGDLMAKILLFGAGVVFLLAGGEALVRGAVSMAVRMRVSPLLIGLTIVAFGTSAPELSFNIMATLEENDGLSFGNIVGSNIANIGLVMGLAALIRRVEVRSSMMSREIPVMLGITLLGSILMLLPIEDWSLLDESEGLTRLDGAALLLCFAGFLVMTLRQGMRERRTHADPVLAAEVEGEIHESDVKRPLWLAVIMFVVGLGALLFGGHLAEDGAVGVARQLGVSDALIGLTIVAIATSLPEVVVSVLAAVRGRSDIAIGNVVGSNIFNMSLVMGATALVGPVTLPERGVVSLGVMVVLSVGLMLLAHAGARPHGIGRAAGGLLLLGYVLYLAGEAVASVGW